MPKSSADKSVFDKDALKQWLTVTELTERWTRLAGQAITEHDVLHFGRSGTLALGVISDYWWIITATEHDAYGNPVPESCELSLFLNSYFPLDASHLTELCNQSSTLVLSSKNTQGGLPGHHIFPLVAQTSRYVSSMTSEALRLCFPKSSRDSNKFIPLIRVTDLVVAQSELIRFEHDNNLGQSVRTEKQQTEPNANAEHWKSIAKQIAEAIDPRHNHPNTKAFAMEIFNELKARGVRNRNKVTPSVETIEREILRGWKTKS